MNNLKKAHSMTVRFFLLLAGILLALPLITIQTNAMPDNKRKYKDGDTIAILGGGVSGLAVARSLIENGVQSGKIFVIEQNAKVGGKVLSVEITDDLGQKRIVELGAQIVVPGMYDPIIKLINQHGLKLRKPVNGLKYDLDTGREVASPSPELAARGRAQFQKYAQMFETKWKFLLEPLGLASMPDDLNISWLDFVKANDFDLLHIQSSGFIGGSGYLRHNSLPNAAQIMRTLNPKNLMDVAVNGTRIIEEGYQTLWEKEARYLESLGLNLFTSTSVKSITRKSNAVVVKIAGSDKVHKFDHLFFTANLTHIGKLVNDLSEDEKNTYSKVESNDYRSFIVTIKNLAPQSYTGGIEFYPNTITAPTEQLVLSVKPFSDNNVYVLYANGNQGDRASSNESVLAGIETNLKKLGAEITMIHGAYNWNYFPHVSGDYRSFFRKVIKLQGNGGLWITGEATSFTATIEVYNQGRAFAEMFTKGSL